MRAYILAAALICTAVPSAASAQVVMRSEPAPARVAAETDWYRSGEPVLHRGELFYPGGAQTFFQKDVMVLVGEFRGVPLYADPTLETGSIVYVPVEGALMQPYEKLRAGELAGTSGSRMPSYPATTSTELMVVPQAVATSGTRVPPEPIGDLVPAAETALAEATPDAPSRTEVIAPDRPGATRGTGIWIEWNDAAWNAAGPAVRVGPQMKRIGTYNGRAVFSGPDARTIWIETEQGMATPWKRN
jgi:hypothetical protein